MCLKQLVKKYLERQWKKLLYKKGAKKAVTAAETKTGEHVGKKAGDKIVQMLSKSNNKPKVTFNKNVETIPSEKELNQRLINLLSGGSTRKRKSYNY